jgi:hypothetical protein
MESMRSTEGRGRARRPVARLVALGMAAAMAVVLLPGVAAAATVPYPVVTITPSAATVVAGHTLTFTASLVPANSSTATDVTATATWSSDDPYTGHLLGLPLCWATTGPTETCTFYTAGTDHIYAVQAGTVGTVAITVTPAAAAYLDVEMSAYAPKATPPVIEPFDELIGVPDTATVTAYDKYDNVATGFAGIVRLSTNDPLATMPADSKLTKGIGTFSGVTFGTAGEFWLDANDLTVDTTVEYGQTDVLVSLGEGALYSPLAQPCRLVDTRKGIGLAAALPANSPQTFVVSGHCGVPTWATAVTGNLTVTNPTSSWAVYLGPAPIASPTSSTINFTAGQTRANSLTVALSDLGKLSATYISTAGNTTDLVFDVTGYYGGLEIIPVGDAAVANASANFPSDFSGFVPAPTPVRVLDTRNNTGHSGKVSAGLPITFQVANPIENTTCGIDGGYVNAVTGNLTVTNPTNGWAVALTTSTDALPSTSTINFSAGQTVSNGVTIGVSDSGNLHATYISTPGNTTDLVFDVTGYFCSDTGAYFVPIAPARVLDTRVGNGYAFPVSANLPQAFKVAGRGGVPIWASAVTGNVTVVNETNGWALYLGPSPLAIAPTSNINFLKGDIVANGMTSGLNPGFPIHTGEYGDLNVTYISTNGNTTDVVFDVSGYFVSL